MNLTTPNDLHVVAHRLPVAWDPAEGWIRAPGGLASALGPALCRLSERPTVGEVVWHGHWSEPDADPSEVGVVESGVRLAPLWLGEHDRTDAIDGFANRTLWPALHGMAGHVEQHEAWWAAFVERSQLTARILAGRVPEEATVWIHDFQHFGLPAPLRELRPDLRLVLSCHTPIDTGLLASIDHGRALASSVASCDRIGTQTSADAVALRGWLLELGRLDLPSVVAAPVGFDARRWSRYQEDRAVGRDAERLRGGSGSLVLGVARADYTKGLVESLVGIKAQLDDGELHPDEFRLLQVAVPTRSSILRFREVAGEARRLADAINARHRRSDRLDVVELIEAALPPRRLAALMRASDVALVPSIRDGMNLVALEYAVLNADRPTQIVLGRGAGAAEIIGAHCEVVAGEDPASIGRAVRRVVRNRRPDLISAELRSAAAAALTPEAWVSSLFLREESRSVSAALAPGSE